LIRLTKIYTKTGDVGHTSLGNLDRVEKNSLRIRAIGKVDTANSYIGLAATECKTPGIAIILQHVQNDLFDLGADLSVPTNTRRDKALRITEGHIVGLENLIDAYNAKLANLTSFVLPGGTPFAAHLHVARCEVREAELAVWEIVKQEGDTNLLVPKYLNRLSDLMFVLARVANGGNDVLWVPSEL
jgi:cob(I)alamin adenosyltransferase